MTDNKAALEAEATNATIREFQYRDHSYYVEGDVEEWDLTVIQAYEAGKSVAVCEALLGPKQWAQFMRTKPKNKDFGEFAEKLFATIGTTEGE